MREAWLQRIHTPQRGMWLKGANQQHDPSTRSQHMVQAAPGPTTSQPSHPAALDLIRPTAMHEPIPSRPNVSAIRVHQLT